jgi:hypothetical protein
MAQAAKSGSEFMPKMYNEISVLLADCFLEILCRSLEIYSNILEQVLAYVETFGSLNNAATINF